VRDFTSEEVIKTINEISNLEPSQTVEKKTKDYEIFFISSSEE